MSNGQCELKQRFVPSGKCDRCGDYGLLVIRLCINSASLFNRETLTTGGSSCPNDEHFSEARLRDIFLTDGLSVDKFFRASTWGEIRFAHSLSEVTTVYIEQKTFPRCKKPGEIGGDFRDPGFQAYGVEKARTFSHRGFYLPTPPCRGLEFTWGNCFMLTDRTFQAAAHEVAHQFGTGHIFPDGGDVCMKERCAWRSMTKGSPFGQTNVMGHSHGSLAAHQRAELGLIPESSQQMISIKRHSTTQVTLAALHKRPDWMEGKTLVRIPRSILLEEVSMPWNSALVTVGTLCISLNPIATKSSSTTAWLRGTRLLSLFVGLMSPNGATTNMGGHARRLKKPAV